MTGEPGDERPPVEHAAARERIRQDRAEVLRRVEGLDRTFDELVERADTEPADDEHDPDGTTAYERAQVVSLRAEMRARLAELDRALDELAQGRYGSCERCGEQIPADRLEALPGTRTCVRCAAGS